MAAAAAELEGRPRSFSGVEGETMSHDKLIAELSRAVKELQRQFCETPDVPVTEASTWALELVTQLDLIFRDGLGKKYHKENRYWRYARNFCHKDAIKTIESLKNVKTVLGQGRAWLRMALNEAVLLSYIIMFAEDTTVKPKYYLPTALIYNQEVMALLTTMLSGLEFLHFSFDLDSANLDPFSGGSVKFDTKAAEQAAAANLGTLDPSVREEPAALSPLSPLAAAGPSAGRSTPASSSIASSEAGGGRSVDSPVTTAGDDTPRAFHSPERFSGPTVGDGNGPGMDVHAVIAATTGLDLDVASPSGDLIHEHHGRKHKTKKEHKKKKKKKQAAPAAIAEWSTPGQPQTTADKSSLFAAGDSGADINAVIDALTAAQAKKETRAEGESKKEESKKDKHKPHKGKTPASLPRDDTGAAADESDSESITQSYAELLQQHAMQSSASPPMRKRSVAESTPTPGADKTATPQSLGPAEAHSPAPAPRAPTPTSIPTAAAAPPAASASASASASGPARAASPSPTPAQAPATTPAPAATASPSAPPQSPQAAAVSSAAPAPATPPPAPLSPLRASAHASAHASAAEAAAGRRSPEPSDTHELPISPTKAPVIQEIGSGSVSIEELRARAADDAVASADVVLGVNDMLVMDLQVLASDEEKLHKITRFIGCDGVVDYPLHLLVTNKSLYLLSPSEQAKRLYDVEATVPLEHLSQIRHLASMQGIEFMFTSPTGHNYGLKLSWRLFSCDEIVTRATIATVRDACRALGFSPQPVVLFEDAQREASFQTLLREQEDESKLDFTTLTYAALPQKLVLKLRQHEVLMSGHLHVREQSLFKKTWRMMFFELRGETLCMFSRRGDAVPKTEVRFGTPGSVCRAAHDDDTQRPFCLEIGYQDQPDSMLFLSAEDEEERESWLRAIYSLGLSRCLMASGLNLPPPAPAETTWLFSTLVLSHERVYLCREDHRLNTLAKLACRPVKALASIRLCRQPPSLCHIEFDEEDDDEASGSGAGCWTLLFRSHSSLLGFVDSLNRTFKETIKSDCLIYFDDDDNE